MKRREFITLGAGAALMRPTGARAQRPLLMCALGGRTDMPR
jgi:hypothetical protein